MIADSRFPRTPRCLIATIGHILKVEQVTKGQDDGEMKRRVSREPALVLPKPRAKPRGPALPWPGGTPGLH